MKRIGEIIMVAVISFSIFQADQVIRGITWAPGLDIVLLFVLLVNWEIVRKEATV